MQLSTKPAIQIHVRGSGLIQLHFAGKCVGFATSYRSAGFEANRLDHVLSSIQQRGRNLPVDATTGISFSSETADFATSCVTGIAPELWVVEAADGTPVRSFGTREVAERFSEMLEAYDRLMPPGGQDGEWSDAQITWFRNHPAPIASACGGSFQVRCVGVH
ncbi:hypothetical protein [Pseudomonas sp. NPDC090201]|uniref:hypothetical protein n=1 Tax=Pseudomonas sp. NPDC090201 TaxID=3364475 RepID=UPI003814BC47